MTWPEPFFAASSSSVKKLSARRQADSGTIVIHLARGRAATLGSPSEPCPSTAASEGLSCSAGAGLGTPFCRSAADGRPATEPSGSSTLCANAPAESSGSIWEPLASSGQAGTGTAATGPGAGWAARLVWLFSPSDPCPSARASEGVFSTAGAGLKTPFCRSGSDGRPSTETTGPSMLCVNAPAESSGSIWDPLASSRVAGTGTAETGATAGPVPPPRRSAADAASAKAAAPAPGASPASSASSPPSSPNEPGGPFLVLALEQRPQGTRGAVIGRPCFGVTARHAPRRLVRQDRGTLQNAPQAGTVDLPCQPVGLGPQPLSLPFQLPDEQLPVFAGIRAEELVDRQAREHRRDDFPAAAIPRRPWPTPRACSPG